MAIEFIRKIKLSRILLFVVSLNWILVLSVLFTLDKISTMSINIQIIISGYLQLSFIPSLICLILVRKSNDEFQALNFFINFILLIFYVIGLLLVALTISNA